jgi:hypothetical protein
MYTTYFITKQEFKLSTKIHVRSRGEDYDRRETTVYTLTSELTKQQVADLIKTAVEDAVIHKARTYQAERRQ